MHQLGMAGHLLLFFHTSRCGTFQQLKNTVYRIIFGKNTKAYPLPVRVLDYVKIAKVVWA
jgi:hypothetical protein